MRISLLHARRVQQALREPCTSGKEALLPSAERKPAGVQGVRADGGGSAECLGRRDPRGTFPRLKSLAVFSSRSFTPATFGALLPALEGVRGSCTGRPWSRGENVDEESCLRSFPAGTSVLTCRAERGSQGPRSSTAVRSQPDKAWFCSCLHSANECPCSRPGKKTRSCPHGACVGGARTASQQLSSRCRSGDKDLGEMKQTGGWGVWGRGFRMVVCMGVLGPAGQ